MVFLKALGLLGVHLLLLVEELAQDFLALTDALLAEVLAQHLAHTLHLGVHDAAIGTNDVGRKHEQREDETVALALVSLLLLPLLVALLVLALVLVVAALKLLVARALLFFVIAIVVALVLL